MDKEDRLSWFTHGFVVEHNGEILNISRDEAREWLLVYGKRDELTNFGVEKVGMAVSFFMREGVKDEMIINE